MCYYINKVKKEVLDNLKLDDVKNLTHDELVALATSKRITDIDSYDDVSLKKLLLTYPESDVDVVLSYVYDAHIGNLVAFRASDTNIKSAKILLKSDEDEKLVLETKYGKRFAVDYKDVVWVNTTGRWPKWVYNLMRGEVDYAECENTDEQE